MASRHWLCILKRHKKSPTWDVGRKNVFVCMKRNERYLSFPTEIIDLVNERCSAKELYALILLRSKKYGYCYMTNQQFAEYFSTTSRTIVNLLKKLKESNVIHVDTIDKHHRRIYPLYTIIQEKNSSLSTNVKEENFPKKNSMGKFFPKLRESSFPNLEKNSSYYKAKVNINNKHLASLASEIEKKLRRKLTPKEQSWLDKLADRDIEVVKYAIDQAINADAQSITGYAQAILIRFDAMSIKTINDVMADRQKFYSKHRRANINEQLPDWSEQPKKTSSADQELKQQLDAQIAGFALENRLRNAVELARTLDDSDVQAICDNLDKPNGYGNMTIDAPQLWERYCQQHSLH